MKLPLSEEAAQAFALSWLACLNRGDVEAVLGYFAEDCTFESSLAEKYVGTTRLTSKAALRAYWEQARGDLGSVHFDLEVIAVAPSQRAVLITYRMQIGDRCQYVGDRLIFNQEGLISSGMGLYGPPV
jgi:ketosteroid isomerase-like protein